MRRLANPNFTNKLIITAGIAAAIDCVFYLSSEKKRKRVTRITEYVQKQFGGRGQYEILKSNCSLLITPCFENIHSFFQYDNVEDENTTNTNFTQLLDNCVDWQTDQLSFKNIPEKQVSLIVKYWDVMRKDKYKLKQQYYVYKLIPNDYVCNLDLENRNIIYDNLKLDDMDDITSLSDNNSENNRFYLSQIIQSERVSIGAYDTDNNSKLIGYSYVNIDDLSTSKVYINPKYKESDVELKLSQLTVNNHFDQGYDHLNANIDVNDVESATLLENMGFKQLQQKYYWIVPMHDEN